MPKSKTITEKKPKFWIDDSPEYLDTLRTDERTLESVYVLRRLGSRLKKEYGSKLLKAYKEVKIPRTEKKACIIDEMS